MSPGCLFRYGKSDLVTRAGLDEALAGETLTPPADVKPEELAADLERLGPAFIKLGQLLSTRADLLPAPYLDALGRLQDRRRAVSRSRTSSASIQEDLGVRISKGFATFEAEPMAAASLGQVHRAELRDGRPVAVKVQRPNIREGLADDLATMEDIAGFLDQHTAAGQPVRLRADGRGVPPHTGAGTGLPARSAQSRADRRQPLAISAASSCRRRSTTTPARGC